MPAKPTKPLTLDEKRRQRIASGKSTNPTKPNPEMEKAGFNRYPTPEELKDKRNDPSKATRQAKMDTMVDYWEKLGLDDDMILASEDLMFSETDTPEKRTERTQTVDTASQSKYTNKDAEAVKQPVGVSDKLYNNEPSMASTALLDTDRLADMVDDSISDDEIEAFLASQDDGIDLELERMMGSVEWEEKENHGLSQDAD